MKKESRYVEISSDQSTVFILPVKSSCFAGNRGYCNHLMALLFELADYSLYLLDFVPEEICSTNKKKQLGILSEATTLKDPIMISPIRVTMIRKVLVVLYMTRDDVKPIFRKFLIFIKKLMERDKRTRVAHAINLNLKNKYETQCSDFVIGSTLSHQLLVPESHITLVTTSIAQVKQIIYS